MSAHLSARRSARRAARRVLDVPPGARRGATSYTTTEKRAMAGISKKEGRNVWYATFRVNGKSFMKSTKVPITAPGEKPANLKARAQRQADSMERLALGQSSLDKEVDALRAAAATGGAAAKMPSVRDYLNNFSMNCRESTQQNKKRAFELFLRFLAGDAERRLDWVTHQKCQDFLDSLAGTIASRTIETMRQHVSSAFNRAIEEEFLSRNPMKKCKIKDLGKDSMRREAFTREDIMLILRKAPAPWPDIVLLCLNTAGQRLGDIVCMRWDSIDFEKGVIRLWTQKTGARLEYPILMKERLRFLKAHACNSPYVFPDMEERYRRSPGYLSTEFTSLLQALGIAQRASVSAKGGGRRSVSNKSFHSLRSYVVTAARTSGITADMCRVLVGHESEEIQQRYFRPQPQDKEQALRNIMPAGFEVREEEPGSV